MTDIPETPVVVNESPLPGALAALLRQGVLALCGIAAAKGWFSIGDSAVDQFILPAVVAAATIIYGQAKTWVLHSKLAFLANLLPDSKAVTK